MRNLKLLLLMFLLFFGKIGFSQNTVKYSSLSTTIDLNSGVEGTVDILVNCYGSSSTPVYLNATQSCGNNDGILSTTYTNGSILTPGKNTTIRFKFKKTVTTDTQIKYKFSTNGSCFQNESEMIKITVNYKAGSTTTPPGTIPPEFIFIGSWPNTSATINEGENAPPLQGTGAGNYTYQWYKTVNGVFTLIPGATSYYYYPGTPIVTTKYFRQNIGSITSRSNEITITVINNATPISNNTITIDGMTVNGSIPTGGIGTYQYSWYVIDQDGDTSTLPDTSQNLTLTPATFNRYFNSPNNFILRRGVSSGSQGSGSNDLLLPHNSLIENNTITLNGLTVDGSLPTGGLGANSYQYSWYIIDQDGDTSTLPDTSQNLILTPATFNRYFNSPNNFILRRGVSSGSQGSGSNDLLLPHSSGLSLKTLNNEDTLISAAYPNPTSGSVNFTTSFSSNKEMEIIVYSEKSGKAQRIFKGTTTPNQIVKWDIPSNYPKGTYYYKIVSDNKEVKTGKILYQ